jgi:uncharacterized protein YgbK (DUF1537 family)
MAPLLIGVEEFFRRHSPENLTHQGLLRIMADLTALKASVANLQAVGAANTKALHDLADLAAANGADQADIDAITSQVNAVASQVTTDDALDTTTAPAPSPVNPSTGAPANPTDLSGGSTAAQDVAAGLPLDTTVSPGIVSGT